MDLYKPLIALLAIVNPIGVIPFFIHFTAGFSREQRRRTIRVAARASALRDELARELAATRPEVRAPASVLYLIWREPWMTVARDTYLSRMLARVNWQTLPEVEGGPSGAARYPALRGDEPWLARVQRVLLSSEPYAFTQVHLAEAAALCPNALVQLVDGERLSWYGPRAVAGLRYLRELALVSPPH